jgi:hypothetical protein
MHWFRHLLYPSCLGALFFASGALISAEREVQVKAESNTRLVVVCVFDQLRGDYPTRWKNAYGSKGFRRIMAEGTHYTNCHYPYGVTLTGPGHASITTGAIPKTHGIIANEWYDSAKAQEVYCATGEKYKNIPQKFGAATTKRAGGGSPEHLRVPTIGDSLKEATEGRGKVFAFSSKDRGAILMAGKKADGCYWWDTDTGKLGTSTYYRDALEPWVSEWNYESPAEKWLGLKWNRYRSNLDYNKLAGPDKVLGEAEGTISGQPYSAVFPHEFPTKPDKIYFNTVYASPFANELIFDLAVKAIEAEKLGQDESPDLLLLSFSSNDAVGHAWGPDSHEVLDITLRTDDLLARMFRELDTKVGKGKWTVYISADHGVCPLPELSKALGKDAGRIDIEDLKKRAEVFLNEKFNDKKPPVPFIPTKTISEHIYLDRSLLKKNNWNADEVTLALSQWLLTQDGVAKAYTRAQLLGSENTDPLIESYRACYDAQRGGDIVLLQKENWLLGKGKGTSHGTPYDYDTHVPLMVFGNGGQKLVSNEKITPLHVAPLIARELGIPVPAGCTIKLNAASAPVTFGAP